MPDHPIGSFEWAKQQIANPPKLMADDHAVLARCQALAATQMLSGPDPQLGVAEMCLEEALDHIRKARGAQQ